MPYITNDPVRDAERYFAEQDKALEKLPKCSCCGHRIQDDYHYDIDDVLICEGCLERNFRKKIEDYID